MFEVALTPSDWSRVQAHVEAAREGRPEPRIEDLDVPYAVMAVRDGDERYFSGVRFAVVRGWALLAWAK